MLGWVSLFFSFLVLKINQVKEITRGGWSGFGTAWGGMDPTDFNVNWTHPTKNPPTTIYGAIVQKCQICQGMSRYVMICHDMPWYVMTCHDRSWLTSNMKFHFWKLACKRWKECSANMHIRKKQTLFVPFVTHLGNTSVPDKTSQDTVFSLSQLNQDIAN